MTLPPPTTSSPTTTNASPVPATRPTTGTPSPAIDTSKLSGPTTTPDARNDAIRDTQPAPINYAPIQLELDRNGVLGVINNKSLSNDEKVQTILSSQFGPDLASKAISILKDNHDLPAMEEVADDATKADLAAASEKFEKAVKSFIEDKQKSDPKFAEGVPVEALLAASLLTWPPGLPLSKDTVKNFAKTEDDRDNVNLGLAAAAAENYAKAYGGRLAAASRPSTSPPSNTSTAKTDEKVSITDQIAAIKSLYPEVGKLFDNPKGVENSDIIKTLFPKGGAAAFASFAVLEKDFPKFPDVNALSSDEFTKQKAVYDKAVDGFIAKLKQNTKGLPGLDEAGITNEDRIAARCAGAMYQIPTAVGTKPEAQQKWLVAAALYSTEQKFNMPKDPTVMDKTVIPGYLPPPPAPSPVQTLAAKIATGTVAQTRREVPIGTIIPESVRHLKAMEIINYGMDSWRAEGRARFARQFHSELGATDAVTSRWNKEGQLEHRTEVRQAIPRIKTDRQRGEVHVYNNDQLELVNEINTYKYVGQGINGNHDSAHAIALKAYHDETLYKAAKAIYDDGEIKAFEKFKHKDDDAFWSKAFYLSSVIKTGLVKPEHVAIADIRKVESFGSMRAEELDPHSPVVARFSAHRHRDAEIPLVGVGYTRRFTLQLHEDGVTTIGREGGIGLEANVRNPIKGSSFGLQGEKVVTPDGDRLNLGGDLTTPASRHEFNVRRYGKVAAEAAAKKWYGDKDLTAVDIEDAVKVNHPNNPNAPAETRALAVLLKGIVADSDKQLAGVVREELHEPQGVRGGVDALGLGTGVELSGSRNRIFSVGTSIGEKSLLPDIEARKFGHIPSPAQTTKPVTIVPPSAPTSPRGSGFTHGKLLHREKF